MMTLLTPHTGGSMFADDTSVRAYYKFNSDWSDSGPNGYNLDATFYPPGSGGDASGPTLVSGGVFDNCSCYIWNGDSFTTISQYAGRNTSVGITDGSCTISAWVNFEQKNPELDSCNVMLFHQAAGNACCYAIAADMLRNKLWFCRGRYGPGQPPIRVLTLSASLSLNTWYHMVLTYDSTNITGYVDGGRLKGTALTGGAGSVRPGQTGAMYVGCTNEPTFFDPGGGSSIAPFRGKIDEVIVCDRAWSAQEVYNYYQQYKSAMMSGIDF